jgi:ABC-type glycerol-3-phosphate transport system permease component
MAIHENTLAHKQAREISFGYRLRQTLKGLFPHLLLIGAAVFALFPIVMILINSFKEKPAIFGQPFMLPTPETFSLVGYDTVFSRSILGCTSPTAHRHRISLVADFVDCDGCIYLWNITSG